MTSPTTGLPWGRPLTAADLEHLPDDGRRYELIDGVLLVSPSPRYAHQFLLSRLNDVVKAACPSDLVVLFAPFDVRLDDATVLIPDLLVAPRADFGELNLPVAPLLAVEVLSPSTRSFDLHTKKDRYREAGVRHYWVVDPAGPSITAWRLEGEAYVVAGEAAGAERFDLDQPFPVSIVPAALLET